MLIVILGIWGLYHQLMLLQAIDAANWCYNRRGLSYKPNF